jgi:hypothetical protein
MGNMTATITTLLALANAGRKAKGAAMTEKHVNAMLEFASIHGVAWTFGGTTHTTRCAFIMAVMDGTDILLIGSDCARRAAYQGPAAVMGGFPINAPLIACEDAAGLANKRAGLRGNEIHATLPTPEIVAWARRTVAVAGPLAAKVA